METTLGYASYMLNVLESKRAPNQMPGTARLPSYRVPRANSCIFLVPIFFGAQIFLGYSVTVTYFCLFVFGVQKETKRMFR